MIMGMPQDYEADRWRPPAPGAPLDPDETRGEFETPPIVRRVAEGGGGHINSTLVNFAQLRKVLKASHGLHKGG